MLGDRDGVNEGERLLLGVKEGERLRLGVTVFDAETDGVPVLVGDDPPLADRVPVPVWLGVGVKDGVTVPDFVPAEGDGEVSPWDPKSRATDSRKTHEMP
jgi:hypothetical protein